jgi:hypothetical protein
MLSPMSIGRQSGYKFLYCEVLRLFEENFKILSKNTLPYSLGIPHHFYGSLSSRVSLPQEKIPHS